MRSRDHGIRQRMLPFRSHPSNPVTPVKYSPLGSDCCAVPEYHYNTSPARVPADGYTLFMNSIDRELAGLSRVHNGDNQIEPFWGSRGCFPIVRTMVCPSLAYIAVLGACISFSFPLWG
ncbi:hypothetical protein N7471_005187 [Penicillium samsonianum]|uniref:uncharacterized protein n=1 Tax=Penicillium samsonianum TaxID=1882272 RepID=UPI002546AAB0|nr:uncharacterized protein N7471_005187 [Penicillium samsonianum]KAJ6138701.1 hypothetical protein N7471_005187 [Penicillium samsonianum]